MASNPYVNKVVFGGSTIIDLTSTTATAETILAGYGAFGADGAWIDGEATGGGGAGVVYQDENGYIVIDDAAPYSQTISITANGTYNVAGYGTADVSVTGGSTDFVVTLSWDSVNSLWTPDCTFAQAQAAYQAGKTIVVVTDSPGSSMVGGEYIDEGGGEEALVYSVGEVVMDEYTITLYALDSNGLHDDGDSTYIYPNFETVTKTYTPTESAQTETVTYDSNTYNGLQQVNVTVNATPSAVLTGMAERVQLTPGMSLDTSTGEVSVNDIQVDSISPIATAGWIPTSQSIPVQVEMSNIYQLPTQAAATITPTTSSQTAVAAGKYTTGAVTVAAMPSGTAGTPAATKGTVSNHSVSVTPSVTNTTGYITGSTKTGTAVNVTASELVSGTYSVTSSGTADVTNYASISVPSLSLPSTTSSTESGAQTALIHPSTLGTTYINIPTGYNDTAQHYTLAPFTVSGLSVTTNGTYNAEDYDLHGFDVVTVNVSGGGSSTIQVGTKTKTLTAAASSISFTGLSGNPTSFAVTSSSDIATNTDGVTAVTWDGTDLNGQTVTTQVTADSGFSKSYSNGTLTITATTAQFQANEYKLVYTYNGTSSDIHTADVQVGSGATSITFSSLSGRPIYWSCIFQSDFSTSSGYQRVIGVVNDGSSIYGMAMDSSAKAQTSWTQTYSGGNLTISSAGTNNGGYFHQPGYYHLTYAVDASAPQYQTKTVSPTTSQQTVLPDNGYDALEEVIVNAMPTMTLPNGSSSTSSGTLKATITPSSSAQYLNIPTGYNDTAQYYTIAASGGGGVNIDTKTVTASNRPSSLSFTSMKGEPKAFFLKATFTMTSSSSTYYYVDSMRYNGTNTQGRLFRMGSTRQTEHVTSGYSWSYSGTTLTVTSSGNRTTSPGCFYNGSYELVYVY